MKPRGSTPPLPIRLETAQEQAHAYLRDRIIAGDFPGGMRLKSEELAARLGISRMPIREALRQLHAEGLVVIRRNQGASVVRLSPAEIMELFSIRAALEGLAARIAAERIEPKQTRMLQELLLRMQRHADAPVRWIAGHDAFHDALCAVALMPRLAQQITLLRQQTRPYIRLYVSGHDDPEPRGLEHRMLLEALLGGSGDAAESAMRQHVVENGRSIVAFLESMPKKAARRPARRALPQQVSYS